MKILAAIVLVVFGLAIAFGTQLLVSYEWALLAHWFWNDYVTKYFHTAPFLTFQATFISVLGIGVVWDIMATSAMARLKSAKDATYNILIAGVLSPIVVYAGLKVTIWFFGL